MAQSTINAKTGTSGGHVRCGDAVWATARAGTGSTLDATQTSARVQSDFSGGSYFIRRGFLQFDISSIPTGSRIQSAIYKTYVSNLSDANTSGIIIAQSTADDTISTNDFTAVGTTSFGTVNYSDCANNTYEEIALNSDGVAYIQSNIGSTGLKFAHRDSRDFNNSVPTGDNEAVIEDGDSANPAQLIVTYNPPGAGALFGAL